MISITASKEPISFAPTLPVNRLQRTTPRLGSVSSMGQHRGANQRFRFQLAQQAFRGLLFRENRKVLNRYSEQEEAHGDNHQSHRELSPLRYVVVSDIGLEADQSNVQPVGDESKQADDGGQI